MHFVSSLTIMETRSFAQTLRESRLGLGLSQSELARKLGFTHTAIRLWELQRRTPSLDAVKKLANFFGVTMDYLAGDED